MVGDKTGGLSKKNKLLNVVRGTLNIDAKKETLAATNHSA
jgi:hypothetical protein